MYDLINQDNIIKKGSAEIGTSSNIDNLTIAVGSALPMFTEVGYNDSENIILVNSTTVTLKKGFKYKLRLNVGAMMLTSASPVLCKIKNVTENKLYPFSTYVGNATSTYNAGLANQAKCTVDATNKDIDINIINSSDTIKQILEGSTLEIETIGAYLKPVPLDMKSDVTITTPTGTVNIPTGLPVGHEFTVRKVNATQGTVSINAQGSEKITTQLLSTIYLNSDGDNWTIRKVSDTRWDVVKGRLIGGTGLENNFIFRADGTVESQGLDASGYTALTIKTVQLLGTGFMPLSTDYKPMFYLNLSPNSTHDFDWYPYQALYNFTCQFTSKSTIVNSLRFRLTGRWY